MRPLKLSSLKKKKKNYLKNPKCHGKNKQPVTVIVATQLNNHQPPPHDTKASLELLKLI